MPTDTPALLRPRQKRTYGGGGGRGGGGRRSLRENETFAKIKSLMFTRPSKIFAHCRNQHTGV